MPTVAANWGAYDSIEDELADAVDPDFLMAVMLGEVAPTDLQLFSSADLQAIWAWKMQVAHARLYQPLIQGTREVAGYIPFLGSYIRIVEAAVGEDLNGNPVGVGDVVLEVGVEIVAGKALSVAGKVVGKVVRFNLHHSIPKFVGGFDDQLKTQIGKRLHRKLHKMIAERMKAAGIPLNPLNASTEEWLDYMRKNPGAQAKALEAIIEATTEFDQKHGQNVTIDLLTNLVMQNYVPMP